MRTLYASESNTLETENQLLRTFGSSRNNGRDTHGSNNEMEYVWRLVRSSSALVTTLTVLEHVVRICVTHFTEAKHAEHDKQFVDPTHHGSRHLRPDLRQASRGKQARTAHVARWLLCELCCCAFSLQLAIGYLHRPT